MMFVLLAWSAFAQAPAPAPAPAPAGLVVGKFEDIFPLLPPPGAKQWNPAPLVAAINASTYTFTPKHYYELLDKQVPADITKAVAAKAAVFYDPNAVPLPVLAANGRRGQPAQTIQVPTTDYAVLFEFFSDAQNDITVAEERIGPATPQGSGETTNAYEKRVRAREENLVKSRAPIEGRIEAATFELDIAGSVQERDGCRRSVAVADMSAIPIDLFRIGMGSRTTDAPITVSSATVESAMFTISAPRRLEVVGRCGTTGTRAHLSMKRTFDGKWSAQGGF